MVELVAIAVIVWMIIDHRKVMRELREIQHQAHLPSAATNDNGSQYGIMEYPA